MPHFSKTCKGHTGGTLTYQLEMLAKEKAVTLKLALVVHM